MEWIEVYLGVDIGIVFINVSYILITIALLVRDILWLRSIIIISELCMITYGIVSSNMMITSWNILFLGINSVQVFRLLMERRPVQLPPDLEKIYQRVFNIMTPREFLTFWESGVEKVYRNEFLCRDGEVQRELMVIISGEVSIRKNDHEVARLSTGSFVAEMSFLTGDPASADVFAEDTVHVNAWSQENLRQLNLTNPDMLIKIQVILGKDLSGKLKNRTQ